MQLKPYRHYFLALGMALLLPAFIYLVLHFSYFFADKKKLIETEAKAHAERIMLLVDYEVKSHIGTAKVLATSGSILGEKWEESRKRMQTVASFNPVWKNVIIYDTETKKSVAALQEGASVALPEIAYKSRATPVVIDGITKDGPYCPCVNIYMEILNEDAPGRYILAVALDPVIFQNILVEQLPEGAIGAIVDRQGLFIGRTVRFEEMLGQPATIYVRTAIKEGGEGIYSGITYEGFENYTAFFTSPSSGWSVHIALASNLINLPRVWSFVIVALGTIAAVTIAAGFILYILREFETTTSARFSAIVESSEDAIISKNLDGIIATWNPAAERIFGFSAQEATGKHISLIIPHERLSEEDTIISKIKAGERVEHYDTVRRRKDGSYVDISISVSPVKDGRGKIIGAAKMARDISQRKRTESQLSEERETLETLNRLAPALASNLDLETLVQMATDEATKLTGAAFGAFFYNVEDDDGEALLLYTLSGAPKEAFEKLGMPRATALFGPTFRGEGTILINDVTADSRYGRNQPHKGMPTGHLPVKSYLAVPVISRNGEIIGGMFFGHPDSGIFTQRDADIAEGIAAQAAIGIDNARLFEQAKQGLERAEAASLAKSEFLATMSHEIRTPMNAVVGLSSILSKSAPLTEKQREYIDTLQASAHSLLRLINDLLDISKIESTLFQLEDVTFSLADLLNETAAALAVRAQDKGLQFAVDVADEAIKDAVFKGDPVRLRQIISNLLDNAIKFTRKGRVSISAKSYPGESYDMRLVEITIEDTGIGIAEDKFDTIFEKFIQADGSITREFGGTGLGLSIAKTLAELMEGELEVESSIGKGSKFTVRIPLQVISSDDDEGGMQGDRGSLTIGAKEKVLLVEDYEPNILVAGTFLENLGYVYEVARTGTEAIRMVETGSYHAVLMDIQMPEMNGFEATREIRRKEKAAGRPPVLIIGVTAHALAGDREKCLEAGMDSYISKPFSHEELGERLNEKRSRLS